MITLFSTWYEDKDPERQQEIDYCLKMNQENEFIDEIVYFDGRPTYADFFRATRDGINILANADIYFDETLELVKSMGPKDAYALTRTEIRKGEFKSFDEVHTNAYCQSHWSQDVWIFNGKVNGIWGEFHLGRRGCDNRIAWEIHKAGYNLSNPSLSIRAIHVHKNESRNYSIKTPVSRPYKRVEPTKLYEKGRQAIN